MIFRSVYTDHEVISYRDLIYLLKIFVKIYRDWFFFPVIFQIWDLADTDGKGVLSKQVRLRDSSKVFVGLVQFEVKSSRFFYV